MNHIHSEKQFKKARRLANWGYVICVLYIVLCTLLCIESSGNEFGGGSGTTTIVPYYGFSWDAVTLLLWRYLLCFLLFRGSAVSGILREPGVPALICLVPATVWVNCIRRRISCRHSLLSFLIGLPVQRLRRAVIQTRATRLSTVAILR